MSITISFDDNEGLSRENKQAQELEKSAHQKLASEIALQLFNSLTTRFKDKDPMAIKILQGK